MKKNLSVAAFVATILFTSYVTYQGLNLASSFGILFLSMLTSCSLYFDYRITVEKRDTNGEASKLKEKLEVEQLKANLERIEYQNIQDKARRDELSAQGKTESKYFF